MDSEVYNATTTRGKIVVVNLTNGSARAYRRFVEQEPGYNWDDVWEIAVPADFTEGLNQYMELVAQVRETENSWNMIPKHLSPYGRTSARPIPDAPFIVPSTIATSVTELFDNNTRTVEFAIGNLLKTTYIPGTWGDIKSAFIVLVLKQPIEITVVFNDQTSIKFAFVGRTSTPGFRPLWATALDANKKPLHQTTQVTRGFSGEGGTYARESTNFDIIIQQSCGTFWTNSGGGWFSQIVCTITQLR